MYINPTLQFLVGLYMGEPLNQDRLIAFIIIWIGILFTLWDKIKLIRAEKKNGSLS